MLAQVQVRLHLESFRNIDLRSQGYDFHFSSE
jgi:hypothetical protein